MKFWLQEQIGALLYVLGRAPHISTGICGTTTFGYGKLDNNGYWQYPVLNPRCRARRGRVRCDEEYGHLGQHQHTSCAGGRVRWYK